MLEPVLREACADAVQQTGAIASAVWLWDPEREQLQAVANHRLAADWVAYGNQMATTAIAKERAPVYRAFHLNAPVIQTAPLPDRQLAFFIEEFADRAFEAVYVMPIELGQAPLGVLALYIEKEAELAAIDPQAVQLLTTRLAARIAVDGYQDQLAARVRELEELNGLLHQQVRQLDRVSRIKTDMFGVMNHELRTPLTAIVGYADILRQRLDDELATEFLTYIYQSAKRLQALVEDGMTVSLIENGMFTVHPERCDVAELARQAAATSLPRALEKGVRIELHGAEAPIEATCDPKRLTQLLLNLLNNAVKFSPPAASVELTLSATASRFKVQVRDQGAGMPPDVKARIFDKYFQANSSSTRQHEGIGVGLMIVRSIVEAHGGQIAVESQPGAGSAFTVTLPRTSGRRGTFSYELGV